MVHTHIPMSIMIERSMWKRIAIWSLFVEAVSLWLLSWVPFGDGVPPGTSPVILWLADLVVIIHFPLLVASSHFRWTSSLSWWLCAFVIGYLEISLVTGLLWVLISSFRRRLPFQ